MADLITQKEIAEHIGVSEPSVLQARKEGRPVKGYPVHRLAVTDAEGRLRGYRKPRDWERNRDDEAEENDSVEDTIASPSNVNPAIDNPRFGDADILDSDSGTSGESGEKDEPTDQSLLQGQNHEWEQVEVGEDSSEAETEHDEGSSDGSDERTLSEKAKEEPEMDDPGASEVQERQNVADSSSRSLAPAALTAGGIAAIGGAIIQIFGEKGGG